MQPIVKAIAVPDVCACLTTLAEQPGLIWLDSASTQHPKGRYSFLAFDPFHQVCHQHGITWLDGQPIQTDPFTLLQRLLQQYPLTLIEDLVPFQGGVAGFFGYELALLLEKLPKARVDTLQFPDCLLGFYDIVVAIDHTREQAFVFSSGYPANTPTDQLKRAEQRLAWAISLLTPPKKVSHQPIAIPRASISSNFSQKSYQQAIEQAKQYILAGDIFEVNLSQQFHAFCEGLSAPVLYRQLRDINPAPFAAFYQWGDYAILSASPERFLCLEQGQVEARPIKGTIQRHPDPIQDQLAATLLMQSEKDRAENVMIVDLMRNDLSRVCEPFSIEVPQLCGLESFQTVHHLVSVVKGHLKPSFGAIDLLKATFPGGSITGAPKIRAMEIIAELEGYVRGPYCGSMGYIGFNGDMDLSILIRTFVCHQNQITFQTGGAITYDSCSLAEYEESMVKAAALFQTLCHPNQD